MNPELMARMAAILPFLQKYGDNPMQIRVPPTSTGLSQATAMGSSSGGYDTWDSIGKMAQLVGQATASSDGGGGERPERFVHGAPQPMPAKIGNPQADFQMQNMQNPINSVGQYLLSPAGQQIIKALQSMGA